MSTACHYPTDVSDEQWAPIVDRPVHRQVECVGDYASQASLVIDPIVCLDEVQ